MTVPEARTVSASRFALGQWSIPRQTRAKFRTMTAWSQSRSFRAVWCTSA